MHENKSVLMICTGQSSAAWHLLTGPNSVKSKGQVVLSKHFLWKRLFHHLFKPLFNVRVRLQLELSARVGPVHEEEPLLGVHLFDQYGCFLVVPHLEKKKKRRFL